MKTLRNPLRKEYFLLTTFPLNFVHEDVVLVFSLCSKQSLEKTIPLEHNQHRTVSVFCWDADNDYVLSFDLNGQE